MINILPGPQTNELPQRWTAKQAFTHLSHNLTDYDPSHVLAVLQEMETSNWYGTSLAGFFKEVRERVSNVPPGVLRSSQEQRNAATQLVATFQPYQGKDIAAHLQTISQQLLGLEPFLAPPDNSMGGQGMWSDDDPMTNIMTDGIAIIYYHIQENAPLAKICSYGKLALAPAMGEKLYTFLDFLKGALEGEACSQATQGEMLEWVRALREQIKDI